MIKIRHRGSFRNTEKFFENAEKLDYTRILAKYGQEGVEALRSATPIDTGATANAWGYEIVSQKGTTSILWTNSNIVNGVKIALILVTGHATRNGGYVQGYDYISPALKPIFDKIANEAWREVTKP